MRASRLIVCSHTPRMAKPASIVRKAKRDVQLQQLVGNVKGTHPLKQSNSTHSALCDA